MVTELAAGTMVTPNVRLVRPLGEGGMGAVWVAEHLALRTEVVVKFIADALKSSDEARERFSREAAAAAQVKSPHVVQTFDHGVTADGLPYIVMELLEGKDLARTLEDEGRLAPDALVDILQQLAKALDRAHERGIVHRDIKPGNIFLCDGGGRAERFVKLLDFGIAKGVHAPRIDSNTKTGSMIGSPFYMSPEQILGSKNLDKRSDLWSVGVVAFEALTGHKPFDAETMGGLAIKIHSEPLPVPTKLASFLPAAVDAWFQRACARNVAERFDSAKEMVDALTEAVGAARASHEPRVSRGSGPPAHDDTLLAVGATTDAGVVTQRAPGRSAIGRLALVVGSLLVVVPGAYAAVRFATRPPAIDPKGLVAQPSVPPPDRGPLVTAAPSTSAPSLQPVVLTSASTTPPPAAPIVQGRPGSRPRPTASAPLPPTVPLAPPSSSSHDIF